MLKRILVISLSLIISLGVCGCMGSNETGRVSSSGKVSTNQKKKYSIEEKKELVLEYLKNKYGEEFEGISFKPEQLLQGHDEFYLYPKKGSKEDSFIVTGSGDNKGNYEIRDGYLGILIRPEYEKAMKRLVSKFYSEYKTYITINDSDLALRWFKVKKISGFNPKDEITNVDMDTYVYIKSSVVGGTDVKNVVEKIAAKMIENKLVGKINIDVIRDEDYDLLKLDKENWQRSERIESIVGNYSLRVTKDFKIRDYRKGE